MPSSPGGWLEWILPHRQSSRMKYSGRLKPPTSIKLRSALPDELGELLDIGEHELAELLGRAADRLGAVGDDALVHLRLLQDLDELVVQPRDDRLRHPRRPD